ECSLIEKAKYRIASEDDTPTNVDEHDSFTKWESEIPRSGNDWEQYFKEKYGTDAVIRNTWDTNEIKTRYSGSLIKVNVDDINADKLAERIGGTSRVRFEYDWDYREFDAISDEYIAQAKPALSSANPIVKTQMKATFEAAKATGKKVYYQFEGKPAQSVIDKLLEYSDRYGIDVVIDTNPLN
ncbi:MAG: restriction endonuclease fold toxin, partial [Eubacteriales bacterium]|nr:restriction endonuclease fold toxin [Eubacteriales bacterium]